MRLGCDTGDGPGSDGHRDCHTARREYQGNREIEDGDQEKEAGVMMVTGEQGGSGMAGCEG